MMDEDFDIIDYGDISLTSRLSVTAPDVHAKKWIVDTADQKVYILNENAIAKKTQAQKRRKDR